MVAQNLARYTALLCVNADRRLSKLFVAVVQKEPVVANTRRILFFSTCHRLCVMMTSRV